MLDFRTFAISWLEQVNWGHALFDLVSGLQISGTEQNWPGPTLSPPAFSLNGSLLVSCHFLRSGWWTDEIDAYWSFPAEGGRRKVGVITVHDWTDRSVSQHEVWVTLPSNWLTRPTGRSGLGHDLGTGIRYRESIPHLV